MSVIYQTTPQVMDQYSRNFMQLFDELKIIGVSTLFQGFFAKGNSRTLFSPDANDVDIDVIRGNERLAAMVPRGKVSKSVSGQQDTLTQRYTTFSRTFPLIEEEGAVNANQIINRVAGESPTEKRMRRERMRILLGREHQEQIRRTVRTCEYLASQSILTGTMPAILGTSDDELIYDFKRNSAHTVTLAESWWGASHDIIGDSFAQWAKGRQNGKVNMGAALFGTNTMAAFIESDQVKELADNRRFQLIEAGNLPVPQEYAWMLAAGAIPRGRVQLPQGPELWLFTYLDGYTDSAGDFQYYMPEDGALFFFNGAEVHRYFGPPERLPVDSQEAAWYRETFGFNMESGAVPPNIKGIGNTVTSAMMYFDAYRTTDKKKIVPRLQSAPIYAPVQTDAYVYITNAGTPIE